MSDLPTPEFEPSNDPPIDVKRSPTFFNVTRIDDLSCGVTYRTNPDGSFDAIADIVCVLDFHAEQLHPDGERTNHNFQFAFHPEMLDALAITLLTQLPAMVREISDQPPEQLRADTERRIRENGRG